MLRVEVIENTKSNLSVKVEKVFWKDLVNYFYKPAACSCFILFTLFLTRA